MPSAEEQFGLTCKRFLNSWTVITSFRQVANAGLPVAQEVIALEHAQVVEAMTLDPEYDRIFINKNEFLDAGGAKWLREGMTKQAIENAQAPIDAASLVFAHSVVDDSAWSYCEVTALAAPEDWEPYVENKKLDLKQIREQKYEDLLREAVKRRLEQLRNESLLQKADLLHMICKPPAKFAPINNYAYDRKRLQRIDENRHQIVHGNRLGGAVPTIEADLEYIGKTANYFMSLVNQRYGIRLDPMIMFNLRKPPPGARKDDA